MKYDEGKQIKFKVSPEIHAYLSGLKKKRKWWKFFMEDCYPLLVKEYGGDIKESEPEEDDPEYNPVPPGFFDR